MSDVHDLSDLPDVDVRLVVADMDGTLLDANGRVPEGLWPLLERLRERGAAFVPASGRQYATLAALFTDHLGGMPVIAENGTYVVRDGEELSSDGLSADIVRRIVTRMRQSSKAGRNLGVVVCGKRSAYIERGDQPFRDEVDIYYRRLAHVEDLLDVDDQVLKIAVYDFDEVEASAAADLADYRATHQVVVSGHHWVDVMNAGVNKGSALRRLQGQLGVTRAQTVAFGDFLNDLEMLGEADASFAMANAHPDIIAAAAYLAPANTDDGVVRVLGALLDRAGGAG